MTQAQIYSFRQNISAYSGTDLTDLKKMIDEKIQEDYNRKENFMLHDRTDDYIYIVHYDDGSYHFWCKGADAYERYINDPEAVRISRKTKDLFPVYEDLIRKDIIKA